MEKKAYSSVVHTPATTHHRVSERWLEKYWQHATRFWTLVAPFHRIWNSFPLSNLITDSLKGDVVWFKHDESFVRSIVSTNIRSLSWSCACVPIARNLTQSSRYVIDAGTRFTATLSARKPTTLSKSLSVKSLNDLINFNQLIRLEDYSIKASISFISSLKLVLSL